MKFLIDAQLPPALAGWLRERGHKAEHVAELGMVAASDADIASPAERVEAVLVTKDEDFFALRLPDRFALLWLRCGNATNRALFAWLDPRWAEIERLLEAGERVVEAR
jgi:predicted nuclease of predicted toxin-antitoxin system